MAQTTLNSRIKLITVIATTILLALVMVIVFQYIKLGNLKAEARKLKDTQTNYEQYIEELSEGSKDRETRAYIEQYARDEMGMIREGETYYIFK